MQETLMQYITKNDQQMKLMVTQLSNIQALLSKRAFCTLPSQTKANPKEEVNVVSTKSGRPMAKFKKKKKKPLHHQKKKALTEESQEVLTPP